MCTNVYLQTGNLTFTKTLSHCITQIIIVDKQCKLSEDEVNAENVMEFKRLYDINERMDDRVHQVYNSLPMCTSRLSETDTHIQNIAQ